MFVGGNISFPSLCMYMYIHTKGGGEEYIGEEESYAEKTKRRRGEEEATS